MKQPLTISIVIPVYNEESYIGPCLDAIAAQTIKPLEVIVVDNDSTDKTREIILGYSFVKLLHEHKQGVVYARDAGFNAVQGSIIARIDGDTILPPNWLEKITNFYQNQANRNIALTGGGYFYNVRTPRFNGWVQSQLAYRLNRFIVGYYILWGSNMALPMHLWQAVRDKVCLQTDIHEDMDLAIHLHEAGYQIHYEAKNLRVGVKLKRVFANREKLHAHMQRWPATLRQHHYSRWWLGSIGNFFLWYFMQPLIFLMESTARLLGRQRLN